MRGLWSESNWHLDGAALVAPNGQRIPLAVLRSLLADQISGNADLKGKWSGWRVRQQYLLAPGQTMRSRIKITPASLQAFTRWADGVNETPVRPRIAPHGRPHLWLAYSSTR